MNLSNIKCEASLDGATARALRLAKKLPQHTFWSDIGVSQAAGCRFEMGKTEMSEPIRILLFTRYVAGLELDAYTTRGVREIKRLAAFQRGDSPVPAPAEPESGKQETPTGYVHTCT